MRQGCVAAVDTAWLATVVTGGAVHTTANTTPTGLATATTNRMAKRIRTGRKRSQVLLVGEVFKFRGELAHPAPVVQAPDEAAVALVPSHVQELLLGDERAEAGEVCVRVVAHDAAYDSRQLTPLAFGQRLAVAGDGHQQRRGGAGDRVRQDLVRLRARDDLAAGADDVGNSIAAHADDVAPTADGGAFEVARTSFHSQATILVNASVGSRNRAPARDLSRRRARARAGHRPAAGRRGRSRPPLPGRGCQGGFRGGPDGGPDPARVRRRGGRRARLPEPH